MPIAPLKVCNYAGCNDLTSGTYCQKHAQRQQAQRRIADRDRPNAHARGYDKRWRRVSAAYLYNHPLCVDPMQRHPGRPTPATQTDHIIPHRGDPVLFWDPNNWQGLCDSCHGRKTRSESAAGHPPQGGGNL